jgi:SAM-dependent methyltransferase
MNSSNQQWDEIAAAYARVQGDLRQRFLHPAMVRTVLECCQQKVSLLDYGSGPGELARSLAPHFSRIVLSDCSAAALAIARARMPNAEVLPPDELFANRDLFDTILFVLVLTTIVGQEEAARTLRELRRKLAVGGVFVFASTHPCFTFRALAAVAYDGPGAPYRVPIGPEVEVVEYHRPLENVLNLLAGAGFQLVQAREVYDSLAYYQERGEEPHRFAGRLPVFLILVCQAAERRDGRQE